MANSNMANNIIKPEMMTLEARPEATPKAHHITPDMMTLEEIKEQLALYNRLYYQKRRLEKDFMETKKASAIRHYQRKKLDKMIQNGEIDFKENKKKGTEEDNTSTKDDTSPKTEIDKDKVRITKPRKYKGDTFKILNAE